MPSIYLKKTENYYPGGGFVIKVTDQNYTVSKLFKFYKHTVDPSKEEKILVYMDEPKVWDFETKCLTLKPDNGYINAKLTEAHVYFNTYDTDKTPLVFVLVFNNGQVPKVENKYYKASVFNKKIDRRETVNISQLSKYTNEQDILNDLLMENDNIGDSLTYQLDKNNIGKYNWKRIKVIDDSASDPNLSSTDFKRYKHTPIGSARKSYILYKRNVLCKKDKGTIDEIQGKEYTSIIVYMGEKAKKKSIIPNGDSTEIDVPLLIELNKTSGSDQPDYYVHKRNPNESRNYYWQKLPGDNGTGNTLKNLLTDMGFSTSTGQPGYNELKKLLSAEGVNGVPVGEDLSNKLNGLKGKQLQTMLKQQVGESGSAKPTLLVLLLRQIEFNLVDSVIVLLEKKDPPSSSYDDSAVSKVVGQLDPSREINRVKMNNGIDKNITVKDATGEKGQCVKNYNYNVYEHDLTQVVQGLVEPGRSHVGIRFIMPSGNSASQYKQLSLYSTIGSQAEPQNLEYKYYHKSERNGESTTSSDKVYVWFYDGSDGSGKADPRPLLLCYNKTSYAPKNKESYFTQWVKVNELSNGVPGGLNECGCSSGQGVHTPESDNKLLQQLDKVVKFLNKVNLTEGTRGRTNGQPHTYEVHKFQNKEIQIQVTCSTVGSEPPPGPGTCSTSTSATSCYKKFEHKPIGMQNGLQNGSGFRLGEVVYNGSSGTRTGTLTYASLGSKYKYDPLIGVSVFYYDQDKNYNDPLLIELEFKKINGGAGGTGPKEYYKLKEHSGGSGLTNLLWVKDEEASGKIGEGDQQKIVDYLESIRYSLKKVMKIYIEKQMTYNLCLSQQPGGKGNGYSNGNGKQIEVQQYQNNGCQELANQGYKCYVHKVSEINGGSFDYNP